MDLSNPLFDLDIEKVPDDWYTERMRNARNRLLADSDWTQVADVPVDRNAWAEYRQQLRDFPSTWTPGPVADFPEAPTT